MPEQPIKLMTWEDVAQKIDWEGGVAEYFCHYESLSNILDPKLKELANNLWKASEELREYLESKGGLL